MIRLTVRLADAATMVALLCCALRAHAGTPSDRKEQCGPDEGWDNAMNMCMPNAGDRPGETLVAARFNAFAVFSALQGVRGRDAFAAPDMAMLDVGRQISGRQFLNLDLMGTTEVWTYPRQGYPELLQIGEQRNNGTAYIDQASDFWGRDVLLQRLESELDITPGATGVRPGESGQKRWVAAVTAGYTYWHPLHGSSLAAGIGSSLTVDALPAAWADAYGHRFPLTARLILQLRGTGRWPR